MLLGIVYRDNKPLKCPQIQSQRVLIFQNFLGEHAPRPPLDLACFACQIVFFTHNYHAHSNIIVPPLFRILDLLLIDGYKTCSCNIVAIAIAMRHDFSGGYNCNYS